VRAQDTPPLRDAASLPPRISTRFWTLLGHRLRIHFNSLGPVSRNLLDACDDGAFNLYDVNGLPLLGNPSHHAAADVLAVDPLGRVALAVGRAGSLPCSTSSKVTAALEGLRCSGRRTSRDALYRRITR